MTMMEPGNVCVWQRGPLDGFSFKVFIFVRHVYDTLFEKQMERNVFG